MRAIEGYVTGGVGVLGGRQPCQTVVEEEDPKLRDAASNEHVKAEVGLEALDQQRAGNVLLNDAMVVELHGLRV